jgi:hypothetical protein
MFSLLFSVSNFYFTSQYHQFINIRNQQLYVLAKQKINALLMLMVKMNTRGRRRRRRRGGGGGGGVRKLVVL